MLKRKRFIDIDCAKGLAIILVVLGHIVARKAPVGGEWYMYIEKAIYTFHMPLFMFLSGWVFYYTIPKSNKFNEIKNFILKKAYRLLVPFFMMGFTVLFGKYFAGRILYVDNPVSNLSTSIMNLFWHTDKSCVSFIWYVYVVFVFIVLTLFGLKMFNHKMNLLPLLLLSLIINIIQLPSYFYFDLVGRHYIYFVLGCLAFQHKDIYYELISKYKYNFLLIFIACLTFYLIGFHLDFYIPLLKLPTALSAIAGIHGFIKTKTNESNILLKISKYTFPIYLFNVPFIGLTKAIMLKFTDWNGFHFLIFYLFCLSLGFAVQYYYGNHFLKKYLFLIN